MNSTLKDKRLLITGGTGSFGNHVATKILKEFDPAEVIIFSRDEKKQFDMRNNFPNESRLSFIIGDVRDKDRVHEVMRGVDYVFHAAALKQVPTCEFFPLEAVRTNVLGTANVLEASLDKEVKKLVLLSTDKAVYPINAMGMTKALAEKLVMARARTSRNRTVFCSVRYGNVMFSRGSVLPLFLDQIKKALPLSVTQSEMTRFMLPLPQAIDLVLHALEEGSNGDVLVRKSAAASIGDLALAMQQMFNYSPGIHQIGVREGEKMHETLVAPEELVRAEDSSYYYRIRNLESINYDKFFTEGSPNGLPAEGYTSANTKRLDVSECIELLESIPEIRKELSR